jgi:isoleucyl-tRNA synthetase
VRLPVASVTVAIPDPDALSPFTSLIADEVNTKHVNLTDDITSFGDVVLTVLPSVLGPRLGPDVQKVIKAVRAGDWTRTSDGAVSVLDRRLAGDEYSLRLVPRDPDRARALPGEDGLVVLDTDVTPELAAEGLARDVVRLVNQARKAADLHVSDRIRLSLVAPDDVWAAVEAHKSYVAAETLAVEVLRVDALVDGHRLELHDGRQLRIGLAPAD